jgi:predicted MPP superfamily phosphohydrolase
VIPADAGLLLAALVSIPLAAAFVVAHRLSRRWRRVPSDLRRWYETAGLFRLSLAVLAAYALVLGWGMGVEPRRPELTRTEIPVAGGVLGRERFRIVHLSDFHLGRRLGRLERRAVELAAEAKPDLLLLTGDYMDTRDASYSLTEVVEALRALRPTFGIWAVGGPVDEKFVTQEILERAGVEWLEDETRLIEAEGKRLRLAGRGAWPLIPLGELFEGLDTGTPTILLQHAPAGLDEALAGRKGARIDLVLCGHTHGGQVRLPLRGALVKTEGGRDRGLYEVGGIPLYVNRGLGTTGAPLRLGARPEVALLELVAR